MDDFDQLLDEDDLLQGSEEEYLVDLPDANLCSANSVTDNLYESIRHSRLGNDPMSTEQDDGVVSHQITAASTNAVNLAPPTQPSHANFEAIGKIEAVFETIVDALLNEKDQISIVLKLRNSTADRTAPDDQPTTRSKCISFPGKTANEAWRFSVVLRILELMHEALRNNVVLSKRDVYYRDPALFGKQSHVDRYVDDLSYTFGLSRSALNVTAAAKGLMSGAVTIYRRDGTLLDVGADQEAILIPSHKEVLSVDVQAVKWILVIEKEATFRSIAASDFWESLKTQGIIITGKGYPDLATRAMLRLLSLASPQNGFATPAAYALTDYDPDGMAIFSTYKHGSKALAHENGQHCTPQLQWLGLCSEHLLTNTDTNAAQGILTLSSRDRKKATKLASEDGRDAAWMRELQVMLLLNVKAELQLLDATPGALEEVLKKELEHH